MAQASMNSQPSTLLTRQQPKEDRTRVVLYVRLSPHLYARLVELARDEDRSLPDMVRRLISQASS